MNEITLAGCTPTPLANYLKALGVLRLLGEQKPEWAVHGAWQKDRFVLKSPAFTGDKGADQQRLTTFFLYEYRPTPIVTPWNGRGGFLEGDDDDEVEGEESQRQGAKMIRVFTDADISERFHGLADSLCTIAKVSQLRQLNVARSTWKALKRQVDAKKNAKVPASDSEKDALKSAEQRAKQLKTTLLQELRNQMSPDSLVWFDACQILSDMPKHAPLLGRGGLDGSMDFGVNFMLRLSDLFDPGKGIPSGLAISLLQASLFAETVHTLQNATIGQFNPGDAGGPNAGTGFDGESLINPWNFVLLLEGALMFLASATKRLEAHGPTELAYPFTVLPVASGVGGASLSDERPVGAKRNPYEMWLPLWDRFASPAEIGVLLAEGRANLGRRPVRDGLGFARAVASLGVDRGIAAFQRYGFLMRSGKAYLATPLSRIPVRRNPDADLINDLEADSFLDLLRQFARKRRPSGEYEAPARIRSRVRQLEDALFELTQRAAPRTMQNLLIHLGELALVLADSRKGQVVVPPLPTLRAEWVIRADDGSAEFRLAAALAGISGADLSMRPFFSPVQWDAKQHHWKWHPDSRLAVWGGRELNANLGRIVSRRRLEAARHDTDAKPFQFRVGATSGDVAALLAGQLDEYRLAGLLAGLVHARIPDNLTSGGETVVLPAAYAVLKPFFVPDSQLSGFLPPERVLPLPAEIVARLQAGRTQEAVNLAWRKLSAAGFPLPPHPKTPPSALGLDGPRLLAALAVPLVPAELARCLGSVARVTADFNA